MMFVDCVRCVSWSVVALGVNSVVLIVCFVGFVCFVLLGCFVVVGY